MLLIQRRERYFAIFKEEKVQSSCRISSQKYLRILSAPPYVRHSRIFPIQGNISGLQKTAFYQVRSLHNFLYQNFTLSEIITHCICSLQARTGISPENMYFFDNDSRNIRDVEKLGVNCFLVSEEITVRFICSALNPKRR